MQPGDVVMARDGRIGGMVSRHACNDGGAVRISGMVGGVV